MPKLRYLILPTVVLTLLVLTGCERSVEDRVLDTLDLVEEIVQVWL